MSLDGPAAATHDAQRGVPAFERVRGRRARAACGVAARCASSRARTLHAGTSTSSGDDRRPRAALGRDHVSFLPIDAASDAFGGAAGRARRRWSPTADQIAGFEAAVDRLERVARFDDGFVAESPAKLRALGAPPARERAARSLRAPRCDAPWWSVVVEADGALRPCFFHAPWATCARACRAARRPRPTAGRCASIRRAERHLRALRVPEAARRRPGAGVTREGARSSSTTRAARATSCRWPSCTSAPCCPAARVVIVDGRIDPAPSARVAELRATRSAWA